MTCSERRTIAYLSGDLDDESRAAFERHLLGCESCWAAVRDDRRGRELAEQLRDLAPADLRDRIRANVELATNARRPRRVPMLRVLVAAAAVVVAAGSGTFLALRHAADPAVVTDVLAMARHPSAAKPVVHTYDGHRVEMTMYEMHGVPVVVASSDGPFPMPPNATVLGTAHGDPWMAHRGSMTVISLTRPRHTLLAGRMPPADLLEFARSLGLGP